MFEYKRLIADHEEIERRSKALLDKISEKRASSIELSLQLNMLAQAITDHLALESDMIKGSDPRLLDGKWAMIWDDAKQAFDALRSDWVAFLWKWDEYAMRLDRRAFQHEAALILERVHDRLELETRCLYGSALLMKIVV